jgi:hypothetical protein
MKRLFGLLVTATHVSTDVYFTSGQVLYLVGRPVLVPVTKWWIGAICKATKVPNFRITPTRREVMETFEDHRDMTHACIDAAVAVMRDENDEVAKQRFEEILERTSKRVMEQVERAEVN